MSHLSSVLAELTQATLQMRQAALGEDWTLAERIQTRRSLLVEQLTALAEQTPLSGEDMAQLAELRQIEAETKSRALSRQQAIGDVLEQLQTGSRKKRRNRVQEAYGNPAPRK